MAHKVKIFLCALLQNFSNACYSLPLSVVIDAMLISAVHHGCNGGSASAERYIFHNPESKPIYKSCPQLGTQPGKSQAKDPFHQYK
jgi:hypothetical protein